jgi:hypothetical protein
MISKLPTDISSLVDATSSRSGRVAARSLKLAICIGLAFALGCGYPSGNAAARESVSLTAGLNPERLGHGTTLSFGFRIAGAAGGVPSPLTELDVRYPADFGIFASGLGLATCTAAVLEALGPMGCPANSFVGHGTALVEVPFGDEVVEETAIVAVVRAPEQDGQAMLLLYAEGVTPVNGAVIFSGVLAPASSPFGGDIKMAIPLVPSLPGGPDVAVVRGQSTIGPAHLTYYENAHGKRVAYTPKGIVLPGRCPRGGFPFAATFGFLDGSRATAETRVPCPQPRHGRGRGRRG